MQIQRLTDIVFALLRSERITAKTLAERFGVSTRTVYRDLDILSCSGIPIFTDKGNGGGISIAEDFRLDRAILSETEKQNVIAMLKAYNAAVNTEASVSLLEKLSGIFKTEDEFVEVDFSDWQSDSRVQIVFDALKDCIRQKRVVEMRYCNTNGEEKQREIEPLKLIFKHRNWYLYAYCRLRGEERLFRLSRIYEIRPTSEKFDRVCQDVSVQKETEWKNDCVDMSLKIGKRLQNRVTEDFPREQYNQDTEGNFIVNFKMPWNDWALGYLLSLGDQVEVLEPIWLGEKLRMIHKNAAESNLFS